MKKAKWLYMLAALALSLCFVFAACGGNRGTTPPADDEPPVSDGTDNPPAEDDGKDSLYTVIFDSLGGSAVESQSVDEGSRITVPANPVKVNYYFDGWYKSTAEDAEKWNFVADRVTANTTLYAKWLQFITVTFDAHNGDQPQEQKVPEGRFATRPATPEKAENDFVGWFKSEESGAERWKFDGDRVTETVTLHAHWQAKSAEPTAELTFEENASGYTVTGYTGENAVVVIPSTYNSRPVTAIGESAFAYSRHNDAISSVAIPDSVTVIERNAFYNRSELVTVEIGENSTLAKIGNNAFSGCRALESIYIPETVTEIGENAFNNCGSLNHITVATENSAYSDEGDNLIDIAAKTLLRGTNNSVIPETVTAIAPRAFSRATATVLVIPATVTDIGNYFIADSAYVTIDYQGTQEQWDAITKTSMWNYGNRGVELTVKTEINILIAYFSWSGTTTRLAEHVSGVLPQATTYRIERETPYSTDYNTVAYGEAKDEADSNARPPVKDPLSAQTVGEYDAIIVMYPIWWHTAPMVVGTFLETYDLSGVDIYPITQSASMSTSQFDQSYAFIRDCAANATVHDGLGTKSTDEIDEYLRANGLLA